MKLQLLQQKKSQVNPKNKTFKVLQDLWYLKLKQSGFDDIEQDDSHLKWSPRQLMTRKKNRDRAVFYESKEEYYRMAGHFLYDNVFKNTTQKIVWEQHAQGKTMREISLLLKNEGIVMHTTQVKETIHVLRAQMLSRYRGNDNE